MTSAITSFSVKQLMFWITWIAIGGVFSFTTWTAAKVVTLEKQTYAYQSGAIATEKALEDRFDAHCNVATKQFEKVEQKLDKTYDAVISIQTQLKLRPVE